MTAITISRQLGSLGDEVAQAIADKSGFQVISHEVINRAAVRAGVPEVALAVIDDLGLLGLQPSLKDRRAYHVAVASVMHELADAGEVIIVGRAGQVILHDRADVMHLRVFAPLALRIERVAAQFNLTLHAARARIETSDQSRRNYLKRYFRANWDDPQFYDLIINTARLQPEQAACLVTQSMAHCMHQTPIKTELRTEEEI